MGLDKAGKSMQAAKVICPVGQISLAVAETTATLRIAYHHDAPRTGYLPEIGV
jgi:hypothetical protein